MSLGFLYPSFLVTDVSGLQQQNGGFVIGSFERDLTFWFVPAILV